MITLDILPGREGQPPMVRASTPNGFDDGATQDAITAKTDVAMVAAAMLQAAAYMFAKGQPVAFGPEIPREVLK